jgi:hypothetical protein
MKPTGISSPHSLIFLYLDFPPPGKSIHCKGAAGPVPDFRFAAKKEGEHSLLLICGQIKSCFMNTCL